ncbi:MAG: LptF/LptG family permease [Planctomycetes bacterium]|nr:LptF/LptG family permease [Planctomycetota bacterium]
MMRILDRYVLRMFVHSYAVCALFILGLFVVIDFFQKIDNILAAKMNAMSDRSLIGVVLEYYAVSIPMHFAIVAPFITLMAAMSTVTRLTRQNELVPIIGSGVSVRRALLPIFVMAALLSGAMIAEQEWLIPRITNEQRRLERMIDGKDPNVLTRIDQIHDGRGNVIAMQSFEPGKNRVLKLNATLTGSMKGEVIAPTAEYHDGPNGLGWYLEDGERRAYGTDGRYTVVEHPFFKETDLTPRQILLAQAEPLTQSYTDLADLARRHPDEPRYRVFLYHHVSNPLGNIVLLLLGLPFVLRQRVRSPFLGIAVCILICGAYYAADFVCKDVGKRGELDPFVASFLPIAIFGAIGIGFFDSVKS